MRTTIPPGLLPEGLSDRLPDQAEALSRVLQTSLRVIGSHGYARVMPPLVEFEATLVSRLKSARPQDLLRFVDPVSQRTLAVRPDITAQVGRIASTRLAGAARPLRLCYGGPVVKLRAGQLRPEREMTQVGAELIGIDSVAAAAEIVGVAIDVLEAAGVSGITVDFTMPDLVDTLAGAAMPLDAEQVAAVRAELDAKDAGALAALGEGPSAYMPLIAAAGPFADAIAALRRIDAQGALESRIAALEAIAARLDGRVRLTLDPTERHNFEYQSWFGFSLFVEGLTREVGRGGSYSIAHDDGREEPAVGFTLYPDPIADRLPRNGGQMLFLPLGHDSQQAAHLRAEGWRTVAALSDADDAVRLGCTHRLGGNGPDPV